MSLISAGGDDGPSILGWPDSGGVAVISWQRVGGQTFEQEIADEDAALHLLRAIEADDDLVLISAQLRRIGTGPVG